MGTIVGDLLLVGWWSFCAPGTRLRLHSCLGWSAEGHIHHCKLSGARLRNITVPIFMQCLL